MKPRLRVVAPTTVNRTVTPRRRPNAELRTREYLTETEVGKLIKAAGNEPLGPPRRHHDPGRLSSRSASRASWSISVGTKSTSTGHAGSPPGQERHPCNASDPGRRAAGAAEAAARAGPEVAFVFTSRARLAVHHGGLCQACRARWRGRPARLPGAPAHAATRLRLRAGQQRARYAGAAGLSRPQEYPAYGALHGAFAGSVQEFLAGLIWPLGRIDPRGRNTPAPNSRCGDRGTDVSRQTSPRAFYSRRERCGDASREGTMTAPPTTDITADRAGTHRG